MVSARPNLDFRREPVTFSALYLWQKYLICSFMCYCETMHIIQVMSNAATMKIFQKVKRAEENINIIWFEKSRS